MKIYILLLLIFTPITYAMEFEAVESLFSSPERHAIESSERVTHVYYEPGEGGTSKMKDRMLARKKNIIVSENPHPSINTNMNVNRALTHSEEMQEMYLEDQEIKEEEQEYYLKNLSEEKTKVGYFRSSMKKRYKMGEISESVRRQRLEDL